MLGTLPQFAEAQTITTIAGGQLRDSGVALTTGLRPVAVAADVGGNLFFSDGTHRVYKVTPAGALSVIAGTGVAGLSGDGAAASAAKLNTPYGIAVDALGVIYIADMGNHSIRKVALDGTISTLAGDGNPGFAGDGGPAASARLFNPRGLALDAAGNLLIADSSNDRVRRITTGGNISTAGAAPSVQSVAVDGNGNIYYGTPYEQVIHKISTGGVNSVVAGSGQYGFAGDGGLAVNAQLANNLTVAVDATGVLYVSAIGNGRVRRVGLDGIITTIAGGGSDNGDGIALNARLGPSDIHVGLDGRRYFVDMGLTIRRINADATLTTVAGNNIGDGGVATRASLFAGLNLAADSLGNFYIAESYGHRVRKVSANGEISTLAGTGQPGFSGDGGPATLATLSYPRDVAVDSMGNVFVADTSNNRIRRIAPDGTITTVAGNGTGTCGTCGTGSGGPNGDGGPATQAKIYSPEHIAADTQGNVYISEGYNSAIRRVTTDGIIRTYVGGGDAYGNIDGLPATRISLYHPAGIALDRAGNLFIAMTSNRNILKINTAGIVRKIAGTGEYDFSGDGGPALNANINYPQKITADRIGNVFFSSTGSERIRKISPDGIISTVAGTGVTGESGDGDGGPALLANLRYAYGVTIDRDGNLLFADGENFGQRIRKVTFPFNLAAVVSRKMHNGHEYEIPVNPSIAASGSVSVEPRVEGTGHTLALRFSEPVTSVSSITATAIDSTPLGAVSPPVLSGNEVTFRLNGIPDNRRVRINVTGVTSASDTIDTNFAMGFLVGDFNNSGTVSVVDILGLKAQQNRPTTEKNFRFDIQATGTVDPATLAIVKARTGLSLALGP